MAEDQATGVTVDTAAVTRGATVTRGADTAGTEDIMATTTAAVAAAAEEETLAVVSRPFLQPVKRLKGSLVACL